MEKKSLTYRNSALLYILFLLIATAFLLIYSFTTSPLYVCEGNDSAVFKTVGLGLLEGKIPYRDLFDHKGPILYFIEALGLYLSKIYGILILQILSLSITLFIWYKTAYIIHEKVFPAILSVASVSFIPFSFCINGGNQCEEWMLPFLSLSYYIGFKIITDKCSSILSSLFTIGLCFTLTFFIRPNDAVSQIGVISFIIIVYCYYKYGIFKTIKAVTFFFLAVLVVSVPILLYFYINDSLRDLFEGLIGFNIKYASEYKTFSHISTYKLLYLLIPYAICCVYSIKYYRRISFIIVPCWTLSFLLMGPMVRFQYPIIAVMPLIIICCIFLFDLSKSHPISGLVLNTCFVMPYLLFGYNPILREIGKMYKTDSNLYKSCYAETDKLFEKIPLKERNQVWNLNLGVVGLCNGFSDPGASAIGTLFHFGFTQMNKYTFPSRAKEIDPKGYEEEIQKLHKIRPKWIVAINESDIPELSFLRNYYTPFGETDRNVCSITLYKRNE